MTDTQRVVLGALIAAIVGFAIGAGWQYSGARAARGDLEATRTELDTTRLALTFQRLEATLGAATLEAQRGNHESARRLASEFFTTLQAEVDAAPQTAQPQLRSILAERDVMITELSRASLESGGQLAELFDQYRSAMGDAVGPLPPASRPAAPPGDTQLAPTTTGG